MEKPKNLYVQPMGGAYAGGEGNAGQEGRKGRKNWGNYNSIVNKIYLKKDVLFVFNYDVSWGGPPWVHLV